MSVAPIIVAFLTLSVVADERPPAIESTTASEKVTQERRLSLGQTFDSALLRDLPGARRLWAVLEIADGTTIVDQIDNGGLYTGEALRFGVHGASWTQASFRLGELDMGDPHVGGTPLYLPDLHALEAIDLVSGSMGAELGGAGPVVHLVPRRPREAWHGTVVGSILAPGARDTATVPPAIARFDGLSSARFLLDGPLTDRLGLVVAGGAAAASRIERGGDTLLEGSERGMLAHAVWTPRAHEALRLVSTYQEARHPYSGRARYDEGSTPLQRDRFFSAQLTWSRSGRRPWTVSAGYVRGALTPEVATASPTGTVERLLAGPVPTLFDGESRRARGMLKGRISPFAGQLGGGHHAFQLGFEGAWNGTATHPAGGGTLAPESVDGLAARLWDYGWAGPDARASALDFAAFTSDTLDYGPLSVDAGLRLELTRGSSSGSDHDVTWAAVLPRVSARVDMLRSGLLALRAGYARYRYRLPLSMLEYGDTSGRQGMVYRWLDADNDGAFDMGEQGPLIARVGPGGASGAIDADLKAPTAEEVMVGLEAQLGSGWTASFLGIHRREVDLVASRNLAASPSAYATVLQPDPAGDLLGPEDDQLLPLSSRLATSFGQDRYVLENTSDNSLHQGVEIALRGRIGDRFRLMFAGTASKTEGPIGNRGFRANENDHGVLGERLENPNAATHARGRLFFDRAYTLNLLGSYHAPWDLRLAAAARYQDGQPFSRLLIPTAVAQGPDPIQTIPNGRARFTYTLTLDARVEKGFDVGRARIAAAAEILNLLDMANEVEEDVTTGETYRAVTAVQPPREVLLELRVDF